MPIIDSEPLFLFHPSFSFIHSIPWPSHSLVFKHKRKRIIALIEEETANPKSNSPLLNSLQYFLTKF